MLIDRAHQSSTIMLINHCILILILIYSLHQYQWAIKNCWAREVLNVKISLHHHPPETFSSSTWAISILSTIWIWIFWCMVTLLYNYMLKLQNMQENSETPHLFGTPHRIWLVKNVVKWVRVISFCCSECLRLLWGWG